MMVGDIVLTVGMVFVFMTVVLALMTFGACLCGVLMISEENGKYLGPRSLRVVAVPAIGSMLLLIVGAFLKACGI